MEKIGNTALY